MAKICGVCGKTTAFGNRRRHNTTSNLSRHGAWGHRAPRVTRNWKVSFRKALVSDGTNTKSAWVCMKCYKKEAK